MSFEPPKQQPPKERVRRSRESEDFNVGGNWQARNLQYSRDRLSVETTEERKYYELRDGRDDLPKLLRSD